MMDIELKNIPIREIVNGYVDSAEEGVVGFGGRLTIRPPYQREFIYKEKQRNEVINTVMHNFPLNTMYFAVNLDGDYELLDGQQRIISICQFFQNEFSIILDGKTRYFHNLSDDEKERFLNYKLTIYICNGSDSEKIQWFQVINIAGEKLTNQELLNAIYSGPWVTAAKKYFSKSQCPATQIADKYTNGKAIRQEILEKAISWACDAENVPSIEEYMARHQQDEHAAPLWLYFQSVISWVKTLFPNARKEMKTVDWGPLYNKHKDSVFDPVKLEERIITLMEDEDVTKKPGIYPYLITGEEKFLSIRAFSDKIKREVYTKQKGICKKCKKHFELSEMEADHIKPWSEGGHTTKENCQMLCRECNRRKSNK